MSYTIPPRLRNSDYTKGAITQDEYLRIAIANDANISAARKAVKKGEVIQPTAVQDATPDQLLADMGKQESDARSNLIKLGFRDLEAQGLTGNLINEPDVLRMFNISFPAIEADVKKRFNPRLLTPAFFLEYLREYNENLNASRGLDVNSSASVRRPINALINNVAELRAIVPDPDVIEYIRNAAQTQRFVGQETINRLDELRDIVLGQRQLQVIGGLPPVNQFELIQEVLDTLRNVPTRGEVDYLAGLLRDEMRGGSNVERREIIDLINGLAAATPNRREVEALVNAYRDAGVPVGGGRQQQQQQQRQEEEDPLVGLPVAETMEEAIARRDAERARGRPAPVERPQIAVLWLGDLVNSEADFNALRIGNKKSFISQVGLAPYLRDADGNRMYVTNLSNANIATTNANQIVLAYLQLKGRIPANTKIADSGLDAEFRVLVGQGIKRMGQQISNVGQKVANKVMRTIGGSMRPMEDTPKPPPLRRIKLGKGLSVKETPTYREFGKYAIHIPQLEEEDILNVKYRSLGGIPKFKPFPVSDIFRDFLLDVLDGKRPSERVYLQIDPKERKAFEDISIGAGVWSGLGLKRTTTNDDEEDRKRFEVLKGIYTAGNNSPQVSQELRRLIVKFINEGKMKRQQGLNLLMELSI
jgi:hypothetical protein